MENNKESYLEDGFKVIQSKMASLLNSVKDYYADLEMYRKKVLDKQPQNPVEQQVKQDMLLNINTLMDKVQIDALDPLTQQQEILLYQSKNKLSANSNGFTEFVNTISLKMQKLKKSMVCVKNMVMDFLNRKHFGMRHGFTNFFSNSDKIGPSSKPH